jgi:hypothetical protein
MSFISPDNRTECDIDVDENGDVVISQHLPGQEEQTLILTVEYTEKLQKKLLPAILHYAKTGFPPD